MSAIFFTGFPGFLGSGLLPRALAAAPDTEAVCLVQPKFAALARQRAAEIEATDRALAGRVRIVEGDITRGDLGLAAERHRILSQTRVVYHLAAVYDLNVGRNLGMRVNVDGTRNVLDFSTACPSLERFHYTSTCYVSGCYNGVFSESQLELGQSFNNFYEETKYLAEVLVRERMDRGLPATIYRPAIVVGDSRTGATQKYDGPYHTICWLLRQPRITAMPLPLGSGKTQLNLVPSDFVLEAIAALGRRADSAGRTFHLADPRPLTVREIVRLLASETGRRVATVPVPFALARVALTVPGVARIAPLPPAMLDYTVHPTRYETTATTRALSDAGVTCPSFRDYAAQLIAFVRAHPDIAPDAMV